MAAPALKGSGRIINKNSLINILLHGLTGPVDGKTYPDVMVPFGSANNDEWVANVLSYLRFNFKPAKTSLTFVSADEVRSIREATKERKTFWTQEELEKGGNAIIAIPSGNAEKKNPVQASNKKSMPAAEGKKLLEASDCSVCHKASEKLIGPAYNRIVAKYKGTEVNISTLANKIISGGMGNWGRIPMTPHPDLSLSDAKKIVRYILSNSGGTGLKQ
jgi:cytochrome c551/c552